MDTLDRLMADDYILTDPLGIVRSKAESLAAIKTDEVHFESTQSDDVNVRIDGDTAVVTGRSTFRGRYKGWSMAGQYQYTDVLVKRRGSWRAVGSHITAVGVGALRLSVGRLVCDWHEPQQRTKEFRPEKSTKGKSFLLCLFAFFVAVLLAAAAAAELGGKF